MKNLFTIFLCVLALVLSVTGASAQSSSSLVLDAASLTPVNVDAVTGLALDPIVKDRSNRPCARIKLHVNRMTPEEIRDMEVRAIGGNVLVMKQQLAQEGNGLIIELTARPETRIYLHHDKYGDSNPVALALEGNREYRMEAWNEQQLPITVFCPKPGAEVYLDDVFRGRVGNDNHLTISDVQAGRHKLEVRSGRDEHIRSIEVTAEKVFFSVELKDVSHLQGFVVFKVTPADALVELDGEPLFLNSEGRAQKLVKYGAYTYTVSAKGHHTITEELIVDSGQTVREVALKLSHGWLSIGGGNTEGAYVYVDSELVGQAPLDRTDISSGNHQIRILKPMHEAYETSVTVRDGETVNLSPTLNSDSSEITLVADSGAEIWINGELKGTGTWKGDLSTGDYLVECRKEGYISSTDAVTVSRNMTTRVIRLTALKPVCGVLAVSSVPMDAEVYVDGRHVGKSPQYITDVPVGTREVRLVMEGYETRSEKVKVSEDGVTEINMTLKKQKGSSVRRAAADHETKGPETEDLPEEVIQAPSENSANCYVVSQAGSYDIPAVRGNSSQSVGQVASAEVLWESFGTSEAPSAGALIHEVTYSDGRIYFKTSDTFREGNAVIAARDISGNILWSWHIWLTDQPAEQTYADQTIVVMDRNLGATSALPGDMGALGLLYQWGRKDPFLGAASIDSDVMAASSVEWPSAVSSDYMTGSIGYVTAHPTTFVTRNEVNGDWNFTGTASTDDTRWQKDKTIYDPCPVGWKVAEGGQEGIWMKAGFRETTYDIVNCGMSQPSESWYPASGYRSDVDGQLYSVARYGYYWSATPFLYNAYALYFSGNGSVNPADYYNRAYAFAIRCQKE